MGSSTLPPASNHLDAESGWLFTQHTIVLPGRVRLSSRFLLKLQTSRYMEQVTKSVFETLNAVNCNEHTEKKNGLTYLS